MASLGIDGRTGRYIGDLDHVAQSLAITFNTYLGTRVMLGWFGCGLPEVLGKKLTPRIIALYMTLLGLAVRTWEPRLQLVRVIVVQTSVEDLRLGEINFDLQVYYRPRGHLGDFTVENSVRVLRIGASRNVITVVSQGAAA